MTDPWRNILAAFAVVATLTLSACGGGGGGGGGGDGDEDDDDITDGGDGGGGDETTTGVSTFGGTVELIDGTQADTRDWAERLLAFLMADTHAAIGGLVDAPDGTPVRLIRIGTDGNEVDELASTEIIDGRFDIQLGEPVEATGDLVIEAGRTDDPVRAPASGSDIRVNPVSLSIVNKVIERIAVSDDLSLDDYRAADLVALIAIIIEELETEEYVFEAVSNSDAATATDEEVGDTDDELIAAVEEGDSLLAQTAGPKNLLIQDVILETFTSQTRFTSAVETIAPTITEDGRLDLSGAEYTDAEIVREWDVIDYANSDDLDITSGVFDNTDTSIEDQDTGFDITIGSDGRVFTSLASSVRGAVSADGQILALVESQFIENVDGGEYFAGILAGAAQWEPASEVTRDFNYVVLDAYVSADSSVQSTDAAWHAGFASTLRGTAGLACSGGDCDLTLDRLGGTGDERKFYAEMEQDSPIDTGTSGNTDTLTLAGLGIDDTGRLSGSPAVAGIDELDVRGFLAPDSRMLVAHLTADDGRDLYQDLVLGLPRGSDCSAGTLTGEYNLVGFSGALLENERPDAEYGNAIDIETETARVSADGAGEIALLDSRYRIGRLQFEDAEPQLLAERVSGGDETIPYSVTSGCRLEVADSAQDKALGAVSPDGGIFIVATYDNSGANSTYQSILIGLRRPE